MTTNTDSTATFDFDTPIRTMRAKRQAPAARIKEIHNAFAEWRSEQLAAGALTTEAPEQVNEALRAEQRKLDEIGRATYEAERRKLAAAVAAHVARIEAVWGALIADVEAFEHFERGHSDLAKEAGVPQFPSLVPRLAAHDLREWRCRVDAVLNPPAQKARPVARALSLA